jgi:hypothetical protein
MVTTGLASRVKTAPCVAADAGLEKQKRRSNADAPAATRGSGSDNKLHRLWRRR